MSNSTNKEQVLRSFVAYNAADGPTGAPPDVSVGVSKTQVMHVDNFRVRVFKRTGGTALVNVATSTFFSQDSTFTVSDPQVVYDGSSGRWFATAMEFNSGATGGKVLLLVSKTGTLSNSTTWMRYVLADDSSTALLDQPKLGLTSDKLLVTYGVFSGGTTFSGPEALVANKADAVAFRSTLHTDGTSGGPNDLGMAPAVNESGATTGWFAGTGNPGSTMLTIVRVDGVPGSTSGAFFSVAQRSLGTPTASPPPADSGASAGRIDAGDTRIANVVWRKGTLTFVAGQGCVPFGDTNTEPCVRMWRVSTPSLDVVEDSTTGFNHGPLYDPAIAYSTNGDLHMVVNVSAGGFLAPSVLAIGRPAGSGSWGAFAFVTEETVVDYTGPDSAPYRWGDYSSAVLDPRNPSDAFIAAESVDPSTTTPPNFQVVVAHVGMRLDSVGISVSATKISKGSGVKITGTLARPGGEAQGHEPLQLWRKLKTASSFSDYKNFTTSTSGVVVFTDKPGVSAQYKWVYPGKEADNSVDRVIENTLASASSVKSVTVS